MSTATADNSWQYLVASKAIEKEIINNLQKKENVAGLIHSLYLLNSTQSDKKLVQLSKFYLGSATSQDLSACITNRGMSIIPLINNEITSGKACQQSMCVTNSTRLKTLNYWKKSIQNGVKIEFIE